MTRYIDAERYKKKLLNWVKDCDQEDTEQVHVGQVIEDCAYSIDDEPSADVTPVIHAHWIKEKKVFGQSAWRCTHCGNSLKVRNDTFNAGRGECNYCPNCGAKMDEKTEEKDNEE